MRGTGNIKLGIIRYGADSGNKTNYTYGWCDGTFALTPEWKPLGVQIDLSRLTPKMLSLLVELEGAGKVDIDDIVLSEAVPQAGITARTPPPVLRAGDAVPELRFTTSRANAEVAVFCSIPPATPNARLYRSGADGVLAIPGGDIPAGTVSVIAASGGATAKIDIHTDPADRYDAFDAAARKLNFTPPRRVLILGDNLLAPAFPPNTGIDAIAKVVLSRLTTYRYGEPKHMEAFNAVLRKLAGEQGLEYFDLYTAMKVLPDKSALLRRGGRDSPECGGT